MLDLTRAARKANSRTETVGHLDTLGQLDSWRRRLNSMAATPTAAAVAAKLEMNSDALRIMKTKRGARSKQTTTTRKAKKMKHRN